MLDHAADHEQSLPSARRAVPDVLTTLGPVKSVVDVGCGAGHWLTAFQENGVQVMLGIDGEDVSTALAGRSWFQAHDPTRPLPIERRYDLLVSLEVAEHLPPKHAETFVLNLTSLGGVILFSAAVPHQPGPGHVNCKWPQYWEELFARRGMVASDPFRLSWWSESSIAWWYRQNTVVLHRDTRVQSWAWRPDLLRRSCTLISLRPSPIEQDGRR